MNLELIKKEAAKFFPPKRYPFGLAFSQDDVVAFAKHCVDKATGWRKMEDEKPTPNDCKHGVGCYNPGEVMTTDSGFIPHQECMVPSGDCFRLSKCLAGCKKRSFHQHQSDLKALRHQIAMLEVRVLRMEQKK